MNKRGNFLLSFLNVLLLRGNVFFNMKKIYLLVVLCYEYIVREFSGFLLNMNWRYFPGEDLSFVSESV